MKIWAREIPGDWGAITIHVEGTALGVLPCYQNDSTEMHLASQNKSN